MKQITNIFASVAFLSSLAATGYAAAPGSASAGQREAKCTFTTGDKTFLLNGKPFVVKAAEIHYPRIPRPYWEHRIKMCKALGMNTICIYIFWNIHEQREGVFDFSGQNDVAEFCRLAKKNGMYVIVRPGPYVCVPNGRWAACPGGCSRRKTYGCVSRIPVSWLR